MYMLLVHEPVRDCLVDVEVGHFALLAGLVVLLGSHHSMNKIQIKIQQMPVILIFDYDFSMIFEINFENYH